MTDSQISEYLATQPEAKCAELKTLHSLIQTISPGCRLWFSDGTNADGKVVANPTIGYGVQTMKYANGRTSDWFRIGLSANKTGISIYILGLDDKTYLSKTFGPTIGKASVTGYCIKFKSLNDINLGVLEQAIRDGFDN